MLQHIFRNIPPVTKNLLILNVLMFLVSKMYPEVWSNLALYYPASENFEPWQFATHFFMHSIQGFGHIFFNMFALVMFGSQLERIWGPKYYLTFYFISALGASVCHLGYDLVVFESMRGYIAENIGALTGEAYYGYFDKYIGVKYLNPAFVEHLDTVIEEAGDKIITDGAILSQLEANMIGLIEMRQNVPMVGASGAIYGLLIGFGLMFPNSELMLLFFPVPVKAKYFIPALIVLELYLGVQGGSNIAHFAHLGGALVGFIMVLIWRRNRTNFY